MTPSASMRHECHEKYGVVQRVGVRGVEMEFGGAFITMILDGACHLFGCISSTKARVLFKLPNAFAKV